MKESEELKLLQHADTLTSEQLNAEIRLMTTLARDPDGTKGAQSVWQEMAMVYATASGMKLAGMTAAPAAITLEKVGDPAKGQPDPSAAGSKANPDPKGAPDRTQPVPKKAGAK